MTFSAAIRSKISDDFRDKSFTAVDFTDIAAKWDRQVKTVNNILREMHTDGFLTVAGLTKRPLGGGSQTKIYKVIPGVKLEVAPPKSKASQRAQWFAAIKHKEDHMNECAKRLGSAFGIPSRRV